MRILKRWGVGRAINYVRSQSFRGQQTQRYKQSTVGKFRTDKQGAEAPMSTPLLTKPVDMWWGYVD